MAIGLLGQTVIEPEDEPDGDVMAPHHFYLGVILSTYGFMFVWPTYPLTGAGMTVVGTVILADDVISHATGWWTPLDWFYNRFVRQHVP